MLMCGKNSPFNTHSQYDCVCVSPFVGHVKSLYLKNRTKMRLLPEASRALLPTPDGSVQDAWLREHLLSPPWHKQPPPMEDLTPNLPTSPRNIILQI